MVPAVVQGAPSFYVCSWTVDDGTPANTVMGVRRREDGYLWVATRAGLFRFNGEEFRSVRQVSGAVWPTLVTPVMCQDSRGRMWVSKIGLVACVDGADIRVFTPDDGLPNQPACGMAEDMDGSLWVSYRSTASPLCRIREGKLEAIGPAAAGVTGDDITLLLRDARGQVWFASGCRIGVMRGGRLVTLLTRERPVTSLAAAGRGGVWFSDGAGLGLLQENGDVKPLEGVPGGGVSVLHEDGRGQLWVGSNSEKAAALYHYDEANHQFRKVPLLCPFITSLADDREGNLWVSTRRTGLFQVRLRTVELVNPVTDMLAGVQSFCEDISGMQFAVGVNGLLASSPGEAWREMTEPLGWRGGFAECVAADPRGGVWLGTRKQGLFRWRDGVFSGIAGTDGAEVRWIRSLFAESDGTLWFGTLNLKIYRLRDARLTMFALPAGGEYVGAMAEDAGGTVWMATQDGVLFRVNGESLVNETPQVSEPPDAIRCLHATPDSSLWIGYATRGLGRLKQGVFRRFSAEQGIEEKAVSQILSDDGGWLWCAGDRGIFRVQLAELEAVAAGKLAKVHPVLCGRGEGWPVMQASCENWPRAARSRSGELCMPMATGMAVIRPQRSLDHPQDPPVVLIDRLAVNKRTAAAYESWLVAEGEAGGPQVEDLRGHAGRLSLGQGLRQLEIEYGVVSFSGGENVRYRYRLQGLDDAWVEAGPQRVAYFSMVPPGRYRFQVRACNNQGVWNETGTALDFTVVPYYWQTTWFRALAMMAAAGIVGGAVWLEMRRHHRRKLERIERQQALERQRAEHKRVLEEERARIARDLHDDLGASLTEVAVLADTGQNALAAADKAPALFGAIGGKSRQMVAALDAIVWAVDPQEDSLQSLVDYLAGFVGDFLAASGLACRFKIPVAFPAILLPGNVRHELFLVVKETLHNAVQHAGATEVTCHIALEHPLLMISIADNGAGFDVSAPPEGRGLRNFAQRLNPLGGACTVDSRLGRGTTVSITLRLGDPTAATILATP